MIELVEVRKVSVCQLVDGPYKEIKVVVVADNCRGSALQPPRLQMRPIFISYNSANLAVNSLSFSPLFYSL